MNTLDTIITAFKRKHAEEVAGALEAAAVRAELMKSLTQHEGWAILINACNDVTRALYAKFLRGEPITPQEQAFAKLVQKLNDGPEGVIKEAQEILRSAQGS